MWELTFAKRLQKHFVSDKSFGYQDSGIDLAVEKGPDVRMEGDIRQGRVQKPSPELRVLENLRPNKFFTSASRHYYAIE